MPACLLFPHCFPPCLQVAILVNKHVMVDVGFRFPTTIALIGLVTTTVLAFFAMQLVVPQDQRVGASPSTLLQRRT
jgi:hypothetical protein